jgi:c-di-GMP-binding flagellar brake protein YcgR
MNAIRLATQLDYPTLLKYLRPPEPDRTTLWWAIASVLGVALLFITLELLSRHLRRVRAIRKSRDDFSQIAINHQLSPEEISQLKRLIQVGGIAFPDRLFISFEFFNACLEELGPTAKGALTESDVQSLRIIRNKIFFGERSRTPPVKSTRELRANQRLHLRRQVNGKVFTAPVVEAAPTGLLVVTPTEQGKYVRMEPGEKVDIFFWRDRDASYRFETEVIGQSGGRLLITIFKHVDDIERTQRRQYHRVHTSIPVSAIPVTRDLLEGNGKQKLDLDQPKFDGHIINLSGAGFALAARFPLKPNDLVFVELPSDEKGSLPVIAKILAAHRRDTTGEFIMNAEFVGISPDTHEEVFRLIYSHEKYRLAAPKV